jgi:DNA-binding MarR family transcriptional regulator
MSEVSGRYGGGSAHLESIVDEILHLSSPREQDVPEWAGRELTFGQMRLVFLLSRHGPVPMSRVAEWVGGGLPAATGTVERLERHGLVERRHRTDDRRVVECALSAAGRELIGEITGFQRRTLRETLAVLEPAELEQLRGLVALVVERNIRPASQSDNR